MTNQLAKFEDNKNQVTIVGKVSENKLKFKDGDDTVIFGSIVIQTGADETHEVNVYQKKFTNAGSEAKKWKGIVTLKDELKSIAEVGYDAADVVTLTKGNYNLGNPYKGKDGEVKQFVKISTGFTGFINRDEKREISEDAFGAEVDLDVVVKSVSPVMVDGEESGDLKIQAYYVNTYNGNSTTNGVLEFRVPEGEGADYISEEFEPRQLVALTVKLVNIQKKNVKKIEQGFGKAREEVTYEYKREAIIIGGGTIEDNDGEKIVFEAEDVRNVVAKYEQLVAEKEAETTGNKSGGNTGFGNVAAKKETKVVVDTDDLF